MLTYHPFIYMLCLKNIILVPVTDVFVARSYHCYVKEINMAKCEYTRQKKFYGNKSNRW